MDFVYNAPALIHEDALIVSDTHFGMERKMRNKGIFDESFSQRLCTRLLTLMNEHEKKKLIILGDVKEDITALDEYTRKSLHTLSKKYSIAIVKGNHDGGIEQFINAEIKPTEGFVYKGLGLLHGHSWPDPLLMKCEYIIAGHSHPIVTLTDTLGKRHSEPVWLIAPGEKKKIKKRFENANENVKLILMPAFNPLVGTTINSHKKTHLGPLINNNLFKLDDALVLRLDGTSLGNLKRTRE